MDFKNKVVLVTGASRGIGKATAIEFAKLGASIAVNFLNSSDQADAVVSDLKKLGADALSVRADVSRETDVISMISQVVGRFGRLDVLVNNTGIVKDVPLMERTAEQWFKTLGTNLVGPFFCSKHSIKYLRNQEGSSIVNVASSNGIDSFSPDSIDYGASKSGLISMTKNLAVEFAPRVRVNAVAPGWVNTDMNKNLSDSFLREEIKKIYLQRLADPNEIANTIVFLASDKASFITGSVLKVDGGY